jgi:hypothetical protein
VVGRAVALVYPVVPSAVRVIVAIGLPTTNLVGVDAGAGAGTDSVAGVDEIARMAP